MEEKKDKTNENSENSVGEETNQEKILTNSNEVAPLITVNGNDSRSIKPVAKKDMKHGNDPHHVTPSSIPSVLKTVTTESLNKAVTQQIQLMNASKSSSSVWQKPFIKKDSTKPISQNLQVVSSSLPNTSSTPKPRFVAVIVQPVVSGSSTSASNTEIKVSNSGLAQVQKAVVVRPMLSSTSVSKPQFQCALTKGKTVSLVSSKSQNIHTRTMVSVMNSNTTGVKPLLAPSLNSKKQTSKINTAIKNTNGNSTSIRVATNSTSVVKLPELQNVCGDRMYGDNSSMIKLGNSPLKEKSELKPTMPLKLGLSKSLGSGQLSKALNNKSDKVDLSKSCFGAIRTEKGLPDDDLTSLKWLQRNDILKTLDVSQTVGSVSPPHESESDIIKSPFSAHGGLRNDGFEKSPGCTQRQNSPSKPPYSFSSLIFMAIEDSTSKKLPVKDIYNWITDHFPYYRHAQSGWKNSVRHNLSLNKCFKKVDKERGQHGIGKGSLWCVDSSFRPNLLQALRKTQPFQPYPQFSTPPPSPHNGEPLSSSTPIKAGNHERKSVIQGLFSPRVNTPEIDPELEAEAAATMCMIGTPPELRAIHCKSIQERSQSCPTISGEKQNITPGGYPQRHRGSFSGPISVTPTEKRKRNKHERAATTGSINIKRIKQELDSTSLAKTSSLSCSTDGEFEFDGDVGSESEDDYTDDELLNMSNNDGLSDSGYGQDLTLKCNASRKLRKYSESDDKLGADALLQLATSACHMQPIRGSPVNGVGSPSAY